jgi:hypothetical protein
MILGLPVVHQFRPRVQKQRQPEVGRRFEGAGEDALTKTWHQRNAALRKTWHQRNAACVAVRCIAVDNSAPNTVEQIAIQSLYFLYLNAQGPSKK